MTLDRIKLDAQRKANQLGERLGVLNLNRVGSPLYVIRKWHPSFEGDSALVWIAYPSTVDQGG